MNKKLTRGSAFVCSLLAGLTAFGALTHDRPLAAPAAQAAGVDGSGNAGSTSRITDRQPASGTTHRTSGIALGAGEGVVLVKFDKGATTSLDQNRLAVANADDTMQLLGGTSGLRAERLFDTGDSLLGAPGAGDPASGDLGLDDWFAVAVPAGTDPAAFAARLSATTGVDHAYVPPVSSVPTGDFSSRQLYRGAAPVGVGIDAAAGLAGGLGENVKIIDIEFSWNTTHEDLGRAANGFIANGTFVDPFNDTNHGTAVLGELVGTPNGFGVTGLAPKAAIGMVNAYNKERTWDVAGAIYVAAQNLNPGDLILIEQQSAKSNVDGDWVPVEYYQAAFDAIRYATSRGIIVVEAAGNGYNDLDALGVGRSDSGAIMVGAGQVEGCAGSGSSTGALSRADFSNFGSRVDVQGWGECVTTTGYAKLYNGGYNAWYTHLFNGTSSASPVVTGAAAVLSSVIEARYGRAATPAEIRSLLASTGTPQNVSAGTLAGKIGPMPNVKAALAKLGGGTTTGDTTAPAVKAPGAATAVGYSISDSGLVPTQIGWSATDTSGIAAYAVKVSTNGGAWADVTLNSATQTSVVLNLAPASTYKFIVAAKDGAGNWSGWAEGATIKPVLYDDNLSAITYSSGWTRAAWNAATGGYLAVSAQTDATFRLRFTGRNIAWVATYATNRGQARVWLDGTYLGIVDLYRDSTLARAIVLSQNVSTGAEHELVVQVVGTANRPKVDLDGIVILK